jgi:hypothetical protein
MEAAAAVYTATIDSWAALQQAWEGSGAPPGGTAGIRGFLGGTGAGTNGWWGEWSRPTWSTHTAVASNSQQQLKKDKEEERKEGGRQAQGQVEKSVLRLRVERILTLLVQPPVFVAAVWLASLDTALRWWTTFWRFWRTFATTSNKDRGSATHMATGPGRAAGVLT